MLWKSVAWQFALELILTRPPARQIYPIMQRGQSSDQMGWTIVEPCQQVARMSKAICGSPQFRGFGSDIALLIRARSVGRNSGTYCAALLKRDRRRITPSGSIRPSWERGHEGTKEAGHRTRLLDETQRQPSQLLFMHAVTKAALPVASLPPRQTSLLRQPH
jgi:hypothetical protein